MDELQDLLSFDWIGTKRERFTRDKWSDNKNCRKLRDSRATAQALLTGNRQLDATGRWKLIACDLDRKSNWEEVIATYKALNLPQTLTVQTPSGGYHIFFWIPKNIPAQSISDDRHCQHFELKGDKSNITAPGSVFEDGAEYKVVRDIPIARLYPTQAYALCKKREEWHPPRLPDDFIPDPTDVESMARQLNADGGGRGHPHRNPRGWQIHCPRHEDRQSSAVLFDSGWLWCSGCGVKEKIVKKEIQK